ncbi:MAG: hypothetical protein PHY40_04385 [Patescibacteria group bacterium]|nr:hypothetical protein [Patescibacteria group bacterium]
MKQKLIEAEIRAEVLPKEYEKIKKNIEKIGITSSHTKRLSVMFFGEVGFKKFDIRVRITNGDCEVVVKTGSFGSHNRVEISQNINREQFIGMVKIFAQFGFAMKIGEREVFNYSVHPDITVSLVSAGPIMYVEIEKMSDKNKIRKDVLFLRKIAKNIKLDILNSEEEFSELCQRLDEKVDQSFLGTIYDYKKLLKIYECYTNIN